MKTPEEIRQEAEAASARVYPTVYNWQQAQLKTTYRNGFTAGASRYLLEIEKLQGEVKRLRGVVRTFSDVCHNQEKNWASVDDIDNAAFWHELGNDLQRKVYP